MRNNIDRSASPLSADRDETIQEVLESGNGDAIETLPNYLSGLANALIMLRGVNDQEFIAGLVAKEVLSSWDEVRVVLEAQVKKAGLKSDQA